MSLIIIIDVINNVYNSEVCYKFKIEWKKNNIEFIN